MWTLAGAEGAGGAAGSVRAAGEAVCAEAGRTPGL